MENNNEQRTRGGGQRELVSGSDGGSSRRGVKEGRRASSGKGVVTLRVASRFCTCGASRSRTANQYAWCLSPARLAHHYRLRPSWQFRSRSFRLVTINSSALG